MRNLLVHAALAVLGIIAGLPVAAVVQWNREPPPVIWSRVSFVVWGYEGEEAADPWGPRQYLATAPDGLRVTSIRPGAGIGMAGSTSVVTVTRRPGVLSFVGWRLLRSRAPDRAVADGSSAEVVVGGVTWHRVGICDAK